MVSGTGCGAAMIGVMMGTGGGVKSTCPPTANERFIKSSALVNCSILLTKNNKVTIPFFKEEKETDEQNTLNCGILCDFWRE
jgi:hypothetical protein